MAILMSCFTPGKKPDRKIYWLRGAIASLFIAAPVIATTVAVTEQLHAGPTEVVEKVRKAAALLEEKGESALTILRDKNSEFMWKDTYVFVVNCSADEVLANPAFPARVGGDIKQHTDYNGKRYGLELCKKAKRPGGGWIEYVWPRSGGDDPLRKISYVLSVNGRPYQVGAGIYDANITITQLERLTASRP